jgi:hypothetical protein
LVFGKFVLFGKAVLVSAVHQYVVVLFDVEFYWTGSRASGDLPHFNTNSNYVSFFDRHRHHSAFNTGEF